MTVSKRYLSERTTNLPVYDHLHRIFHELSVCLLLCCFRFFKILVTYLLRINARLHTICPVLIMNSIATLLVCPILMFHVVLIALSSVLLFKLYAKLQLTLILLSGSIILTTRSASLFSRKSFPVWSLLRSLPIDMHDCFDAMVLIHICLHGRMQISLIKVLE